MRRPRPQSFGDLDTVDVLLVEDEDEDVGADEVRMVLHELALEATAWRATWPGEPERLSTPEAPVAGPAGPGLARRVARRYRRRAMAGAVLTLAVAATIAVVDVRQTAARAAALAATPAVLTEMSRPPAEVWRVPGKVVSDQDERLLLVEGASLRAVSPATGEVIWTASEAAGRAASTGGCFSVDDGLMSGRTPVEDEAGRSGLVACVADAPGGSSPPDGATASASVVVVDPASGRTRHTIAADGELLLAEPVGQDLLVAAARADGRVRATRWDVAAGTPRWDSVSPLPVTGGVADAVERRPDSLTIRSFAVDLGSGEQLDAELESGRPYSYGEHRLPDGARATWSWQQDGTFGRGRVSGGDPGSSYILPGPPLRPRVTDGSDAGVLVVQTARGDRLRGLNLRTGRMRWTQLYPATPSLRATALVDGVMLLDDGATVTALDVRSGDVIWRARVDAEATDGAALTDGQVVLLPGRADDGALQLVAHRIADGTVVWRTQVPPGTLSVDVVDHHLVAATDDEVIGLG